MYGSRPSNGKCVFIDCRSIISSAISLRHGGEKADNATPIFHKTLLGYEVYANESTMKVSYKTSIIDEV